MYAQGSALAAFAAWLLLRALASPRPSWRLWTTYAITAVAFGYTHNYAPFSLLAQAMFAAGWLARRSDWRVGKLIRSAQFRAALLTGIAVLCTGLAWAPTLLAQRDRTSTHRLAPLHGLPLKNACYELLIDPQDPFAPRGTSMAATIITLGVLVGLAWRPVAGDVYLLLSAIVPPLVAAAITLADIPVFHSHYLQFAHLFFLAGAARLLTRISDILVRSVVAACVVANLLAVNYSFWAHLDIERKPGTRAAAVFIEHSRRRGEPVVVVSPFYFSPLLYYLHDRQNCYLFDDGEQLQAYEGPAIIKRLDRIDLSRMASGGWWRFWAVNVDSPGTTWQRRIVPVPEGCREVSRRRFAEAYYVQGAVEVAEYEIAGSATSTSIGSGVEDDTE
jgi:hypothetical protein